MTISPPTENYWNGFYQTSVAPNAPSAFAEFVAGKSGDRQFIIDFGCGNGRDSFFFATQGLSVLSIDRSDIAIAAIAADGRVSARSGAIESAEIEQAVLDWVKASPHDAQSVLYARFFVHAINEDQERAFLGMCTQAARLRSTTLALEFRTAADASLKKTTSPHYRRFIEPSDFVRRAEALGWRLDYFIEGFGLARFKDEDPHIARMLLSM